MRRWRAGWTHTWRLAAVGLQTFHAGYSIKLFVEGNNLIQAKLPHQDGVIGVNEREVEVDIQVEYCAEAPLAG